MRTDLGALQYVVEPSWIFAEIPISTSYGWLRVFTSRAVASFVCLVRCLWSVLERLNCIYIW